MIDLALWLNPLTGDNPSGDDLRNDAGFHELERLAEPAIKVEYDERNRPVAQTTVAPDWSVIFARADELRQKGRDLRLMVLVTRALAGEEGLAGLAQGLSLLGRTLDEYWDSLHPALRGGAPREAALRRTNALLDLQNPEAGVLGELRRKAFFTLPGIGPVSGRDLEMGTLDERVMLQEAAQGLGVKEKAVLAEAHAQLVSRVRGACAGFADRSPDDFAALVQGGRDSLSAMDELDRVLNARLETHGPTVPDLKRFVERVLATLERTNAMKKADAPAIAANGEAAPAAPNGVYREPQPIMSGGGLPDRIASRDEVVKCLDLVVDFYDRTEPSSPIPHLARRVRRMVHMDFVELMEDLAPSGLKEFRLLAGTPEPKKAAVKDER
ncbi:MAG: type VI secretion system protein TssA [Rhizobiaceae bacterium]|nr:type VI secretion system protein TssA [Rhizobiaceae bacterium]